jgi:NAD(P)H-dependent FMN reductase
MSVPGPNVLVVNGSTSANSTTKAVLKLVMEKLSANGAPVDFLDLSATSLALFNPETAYSRDDYQPLKKRVEAADVLLLGTPDYHGCMSSALKNFLDHFWHEYAGKLIATIVASYDKGLTVTDQIRTLARQCYAWSLPYAVSYADKADFKDGQIVSDSFAQRLEILSRDLCTYGALLARQRKADLASTEPGFMARFRGPSRS